MLLSWTPEEIAEMERFDRQLEQEFKLTEKEIAFSSRMDRVARRERMEDQAISRDSARIRRKQKQK